ncbi:hypothetical protein [Hoeflea sp.]|uniref:hypothetical protein n=1 Tax=Hoeflea sp. TaxID=1940281 RepID=UPI003BAE6E18
MLIGRGTFTPAPPHTLRGTFSLTRQSGGVKLETSDSFFFDGSPAPGFALHTGVPVDAQDPVLRANMVATRFLDLPGNVVPVSGVQTGLIPDTTDIDAYDTLVLWCFAVPFILGFGPIERV